MRRLDFKQLLQALSAPKLPKDAPNKGLDTRVISSVMSIALMLLMAMSLLMVTSASMPITMANSMPDLYYFRQQSLFMVLGIVSAFVMYKLPLRLIVNTQTQAILLIGTVILLFLTLFSTPINGSRRWLNLIVLNFQPAELAKLVTITLCADYLVRRSYEVRHTWTGWIRLLCAMGFVLGLLILQPDFGSFAIIMASIFLLFFVAGAPPRQYVLFGGLGAILLGVLVMRTGYRSRRVLSFLDPFDDMQNSDYQLSRSLIAFGRGEFSGVGFGQSVQKLAHLPEAHTDFLLSITGEELGFLGVALVLLLEATLIVCLMLISRRTLIQKQLRLSYMTFGFGILIFAQTMINAGMTMGILPTKGLTMPFFSYGGSSMLMCLTMMGIAFNINKNAQDLTQDARNY